MSRHDCRLSGTLTLKPGVTRAQILDVLQDFVEEHKLSHNLGDHAPELEPGETLAFDFEAPSRELHVYADVRGYGDETGEYHELGQALSPLTDGPQVLEFEDFDSGSLADAMTPVFIGPTPQDALRAQLRYAADAFARWADCQPLEQLVYSMVDHYPVDVMLDSPGAAPAKSAARRTKACGIGRTDLLVTVLHEINRGTEISGMALSDLHMEIDTGASVGQVRHLATRELANIELQAELQAVGNDGAFFDTVDAVAEALGDDADVDADANAVSPQTTT